MQRKKICQKTYKTLKYQSITEIVIHFCINLIKFNMDLHKLQLFELSSFSFNS